MNVTKEMKEKAAARLVAVWWLPQGLAGDYARCALEGALADVPEPGETQSRMLAGAHEVGRLEDRVAELEAQLAEVREWARGHSCATPRAVTDLLAILGDERAIRLEGVQQKMAQAFYADVLKLEDRIAELEAQLAKANVCEVCGDCLMPEPVRCEKHVHTEPGDPEWTFWQDGGEPPSKEGT